MFTVNEASTFSSGPDISSVNSKDSDYNVPGPYTAQTSHKKKKRVRFVDPPSRPPIYDELDFEISSKYSEVEGVVLHEELVTTLLLNEGADIWGDSSLFERELQLLSEIADEPATDPPMSKLAVTCKYLPLGKKIHIQLSLSNSTSLQSVYVTVRDVFVGIRNGLWKRTRREEYYSLSRYMRKYASYAYTRRCQRPDAECQEESDGLKYIDLLYPGVNWQNLGFLSEVRTMDDQSLSPNAVENNEVMGSGIRNMTNISNERNPEEAHEDDNDLTITIPGYFNGAHHFTMSGVSLVDNSIKVNGGNGYMLAAGGIIGLMLNAQTYSPTIDISKVSSKTHTVNVEIKINGNNGLTDQTYTISMPISPNIQNKVEIGTGQVSITATYLPEKERGDEDMEKRCGFDVTPPISYATGQQSWTFALYSRKFKRITSVASVVLWGFIACTTLINNI